MSSAPFRNRPPLPSDDPTPPAKRIRHSASQPAIDETDEAQDSSFEVVPHPSPPPRSPKPSPISSCSSSSSLIHREPFPTPTSPSLEHSSASSHPYQPAQEACSAPSHDDSEFKAPLVQRESPTPCPEYSASQEASESGQSPTASVIESDSDMAPAKYINYEEVRKNWKKNNHFYNARGARERGADIISIASDILDDQRASPTADEKIDSIRKVSERWPNKGEDTFMSEIEKVLFNTARMVPKPGIPSTQKLTIDDYEPEPRAWEDDFLGRKLKGPFRKDSLPQPEDKAPLLPDFHPRMETAIPDMTWGLDEDLLPAQWTWLFEKYGPKQLGRELFFPFLTADLKTRQQPLAEAENQCMRAGSSMVWNHYQLKAIYNDSKIPLPEIASREVQPADPDIHISTPDTDSIAFTVALIPNATLLHVHWIESWSNGAIYHHTTPLKIYSLQEGFEDQIRDFQRHLSNILDWGLLQRTPQISEKARVLAKKRFREDYDLPTPEPKRQMTGNE